MLKINNFLIGKILQLLTIIINTILLLNIFFVFLPEWYTIVSIIWNISYTLVLLLIFFFKRISILLKIKKSLGKAKWKIKATSTWVDFKSSKSNKELKSSQVDMLLSIYINRSNIWFYGENFLTIEVKTDKSNSISVSSEIFFEGNDLIVEYKYKNKISTKKVNNNLSDHLGNGMIVLNNGKIENFRYYNFEINNRVSFCKQFEAKNA